MSFFIDNLNGCRNIPNKEHMFAYPHKKWRDSRWIVLDTAGFRVHRLLLEGSDRQSWINPSKIQKGPVGKKAKMLDNFQQIQQPFGSK